MKRPLFLLLVTTLCLLLAAPAVMAGRHFFQTKLIGYDEVPALSSTGHGTFSAEINRTDTQIDFTLTYADLSAFAAAAHIHIAQPGVAGGVMAFLCGGGGKPACPASPATVTGSIVAADVVGPAAQGIAAGDFAAVLAAMRAGRSYANVHTINFPAGEIRGNMK
jgi:CHRD domain-containing protein